MKTSFRLLRNIVLVVLVGFGGWSAAVGAKALYEHIKQDHFNAHVVNMLIDYNVQQGKLVVPPEWLKK